MNTKRALPMTLTAFASVAWIAGCGGELPQNGADDPDDVTGETNALVTNAEAVRTDGVGEAETNSLINVDNNGNTIDIVTYNDLDFPPFLEYTNGTPHGDQRTVRTSAGLLGWDTKVNGG